MITTITIPLIKRWILLFIAILNLSCASQSDVNALKIDAVAFCDAHNPANWNNFTGETIEEANIELKKVLSEVISTDQFKAVVSELGEYGYDRKLYQIAQEKISPIIGQKWTCDYFKYYFTTTLYSEKTGLALSTQEIMISIDKAGKTTVNKVPLPDTTAETLKQFILSLPQFSTLMKFTIHINDEAPANSLIQTFFTLGKLDIGNISVQASDEKITALREALNRTQ